MGSPRAPTINPGGPFPNTDPLLPSDPEETMGETVARINGVPEPDFDLTFIDVWTDPAVRAKDAPYLVSYGSLQTPSPVEPACELTWLAGCRITIHYEDHIHPLWGVLRQLIDPRCPHRLGTIAAKVTIPEIIREDENNVRG